jgi:TolB-like protein
MQSGIQTEGSDLRVNVRIVRRADGTVVWAGGYRANLKTEKILDVQAKIAHSLALAVVQSLEFGDTTAEP